MYCKSHEVKKMKVARLHARKLNTGDFFSFFHAETYLLVYAGSRKIIVFIFCGNFAEVILSVLVRSLNIEALVCACNSECG